MSSVITAYRLAKTSWCGERRTLHMWQSTVAVPPSAREPFGMGRDLGAPSGERFGFTGKSLLYVCVQAATTVELHSSSARFQCCRLVLDRVAQACPVFAHTIFSCRKRPQWNRLSCTVAVVTSCKYFTHITFVFPECTSNTCEALQGVLLEFARETISYK